MPLFSYKSLFPHVFICLIGLSKVYHQTAWGVNLFSHQVCGFISSFPPEAFDLPALVKTSALRPVAELFSGGSLPPSCRKYDVLCFILHYIPFVWIPWLPCFFFFFSLSHSGRLCTEKKYDKNGKKNRPCLYIKP